MSGDLATVDTAAQAAGQECEGGIAPVRSPALNRDQKIGVCLVERNALAAGYLRTILAILPNIEIHAEAQALSRPFAPQNPPDIFVIDASTLPDPLASYLTILRSRFEGVTILLLSEELSPDELRRLPFLGIQGFVRYGDVRERLGSAIEAVSAGNRWFPPEVLNEFLAWSKSLQSKTQPGGKRRDIFTPREKLIAGLLERRLGNKEIAKTLKISESTVKFHLSNIFRKLGVRDRHSAAEVKVAIRKGRSLPFFRNRHALFPSRVWPLFVR